MKIIKINPYEVKKQIKAGERIRIRVPLDLEREIFLVSRVLPLPINNIHSGRLEIEEEDPYIGRLTLYNKDGFIIYRTKIREEV